jgi:dolichyl-diphosphooligosaccharide--protein glycosyltransferase
MTSCPTERVCHNERTIELEPTPAPQQERAGWLAAILNRWYWIVVAGLGLLALCIRVIPRFDLVFQSGFVNFQETDAWYHVRVAENLVKHFPWRSMVDPYVIFGQVHDTATAPFYDWLLGLIAWLAGGGAPSESLLDGIAAWYPAVLAVFEVVAVFVLARLVFGLRAALVAAAVIATLPGHYLRVSSLGFTDHHIMESLLVTLFFFLLLHAMERPPALGTSITSGFTLAAYLLTFHGSAIVVGVVVAWAIYDRVRWFSAGEKSDPTYRPLYVAFLIALSICLVFHNLLWMNYTIAALVLGTLGIGALELWAKLCRRFRRPGPAFFGGLAAGGLAIVAVTAVLANSLRHPAKIVVTHLMPSLFGTSGGVDELQSPVYELGHFTLIPALRQFYGAFFFALIGLFLLGGYLLKRRDPGRALIFFWGLTTFVLAMGQLRMTYYYAIAVALATGFAADCLIASGRKAAWAIGLCLALLVFGPNLYAAINGYASTGISEDWKETLQWMRASTPEPFVDPAFFYARYRRRDFGPDYRYPSSAYSVLAWWDYGYWIEDVARRIPVTNPTQENASAAADFFLAQSEQEAVPLLQAQRARYVVVDERLPLWPSEQNVMVGDFPLFFAYARRHRQREYLLLVYESNAAGELAPRMFYLPAYYRSMAIRLFVFGGQAVDGRDGATILSLRQKTFPNGRTYQEVLATKRFESGQAALAAEMGCRNEGCVLVGDNPMVSPVALEPLQQLRPVFASTSSVLGFGSSGRKAVQVYEFTGATR